MHTQPEQWYLAKKEDTARVLRANFSVLEETDTFRYDTLHRLRNLYRDGDFKGIRPWDYRRRDPETDRLPENMLRPLVDTLTAKLIRDRPRVTAFTTGGGLEARQRAKNLSKFWDGVWAQNRVHARLGQYVRDGLVTGDGVFHVRVEVSPDNKRGKVCIDSVSVNELYVDSVEAFYGEPKRLYRRRWFDRTLLMSLFPQHEDEIRRAATAGDRSYYVSGTGPLIDLVEVVEAWNLPTSLEGADGRYAMVCGDALLKDEEWIYEDFPFVHFQPTPPMTNDGYWGTGIVEVLQEHQVHLSQTAEVVNSAQRVGGRPWIMVEQNSEVVLEHLTNDMDGVIVKYKGTPPTWYSADPVPPQTYMDVDNRRRKMIEDSGVSRMSLTSNKPVGFDPSGKAIQEMSDVESERFMEMGRGLQESMYQLAKWTVWLARELDQRLEGGYKVTVRDGQEAFKISWKDVDVPDDAFIMHSDISSWHGRSFSGRLADVERMANSGLIQDPAVLALLLQNPDLESYLNKKASPTQVVEMMANVMLTKGKFIAPEPYMDLNQAIHDMQLILLSEYSKREGTDDTNLQLLRDWLEQASGLLSQANQQETVAQQAASASVVAPDQVVAPGGPAPGGLPPQGAGGGLPVA